MHKIVNGIEVELTEEEAALKVEEWAAEDSRSEAYQTQYGYISKRKKEYPDIGDQLDAILKHLNYMQLDGQTDLVKELDAIVGQWLAVKAKHPKPE